MKKLNQITTENFNQSFDLQDILTDSVFYPASGTDGLAVKCLGHKCNSFIHVDYSTSREEFVQDLHSGFQKVGYELVGWKEINQHELNPTAYAPQIIPSEHEARRLKMDFIAERATGKAIRPFAIWAVFELRNPNAGLNNGPKINKFSLLHIGGEGAATFEILYGQHRINPKAVALINPSEGFGDNWTRFTDPRARLFQAIRRNVKLYQAEMPKYFIERCIWDQPTNPDWPGYQFAEWRHKKSIGLSVYQ